MSLLQGDGREFESLSAYLRPRGQIDKAASFYLADWRCNSSRGYGTDPNGEDAVLNAVAREGCGFDSCRFRFMFL